MPRRPPPSFSRLDGTGLLFDHWMTANLISVNYGAAERGIEGKMRENVGVKIIKIN